MALGGWTPQETVESFQARAEMSFRDRLALKDAEIERLKARLRYAHLRLNVVERTVVRLRESWRGRASQGQAVAIVAKKRVLEALHGTRDC